MQISSEALRRTDSIERRNGRIRLKLSVVMAGMATEILQLQLGEVSRYRPDGVW
jgi:hypothetical protein